MTGGVQAAPAPATWDSVGKLKDQVTQLRKAGKVPEALALCEKFLIEHPNEDWMTGNIMFSAMDIIREDYADPAQREELLLRIHKGFEASPWYWAAALQPLVQGYAWGDGGLKADPAKALEMVDGAWEKLVDKLPHDLYLLQYAGINKVVALNKLNRPDDAIKFCSVMLSAVPQMLGVTDFYNAWWEALKAKGDAPALVSLAKLNYVTCDFTANDLKAAIDRCSSALSVAGGPGPGVLFTRCQDDPSLRNPLREVKLPALPPAEDLLKAAGKDTDAQILVYLATEQLALATAVAKKQLMEHAGGDAKRVALTMRNLARCFKAHDLNLKRANGYLEYHRSGTGWQTFVRRSAMT
jgi:tetratricopeptide (TPR) repeat protein